MSQGLSVSVWAIQNCTADSMLEPGYGLKMTGLLFVLEPERSQQELGNNSESQSHIAEACWLHCNT